MACATNEITSKSSWQPRVYPTLEETRQEDKICEGKKDDCTPTEITEEMTSNEYTLPGIANDEVDLLRYKNAEGKWMTLPSFTMTAPDSPEPEEQKNTSTDQGTNSSVDMCDYSEEPCGKRACVINGPTPSGNTFEPPARLAKFGTLYSPYKTPLYTPYPYSHGRYGDSESPIASLQSGLNKIANPDNNRPETLAKAKVKNAFASRDKKESEDKRSVKVKAKHPENYMGLAILICVMFNCPLGIVAIFISRSATTAFSDGDMAKGQKRALCSLIVSLVSIVVTVLGVIGIVFLVAAHSH